MCPAITVTGVQVIAHSCMDNEQPVTCSYGGPAAHACMVEGQMGEVVIACDTVICTYMHAHGGY